MYKILSDIFVNNFAPHCIWKKYTFKVQSINIAYITKKLGNMSNPSMGRFFPLNGGKGGTDHSRGCKLF